MSLPEPPAFKHDCDDCQYLGRIGENNQHDVYLCLSKHECLDTLIVRFSSEGNKYFSSDLEIIIPHLEPLLEAKRPLAFAYQKYKTEIEQLRKRA